MNDAVTLPPAKEFNEFLDTIQIEQVRLVRLNVESLIASLDPSNTQVDPRPSAGFGWVDDGFEIGQRLDVAVKDNEGSPLGSIVVELGLKYRLTVPVDRERMEPLIKAYIQQRVLITAWPYLRELVANVTVRMSWPALTLPLFILQPSTQAGAEAVDPTTEAEVSNG
jgi:hypothetical protein